MKKTEKIIIPKLPDEMLTTIDSFQAIVAFGKKRPTLDKDQHIQLVQTKYTDGRNIADHATLFRLKDKYKIKGIDKGLTGKERDEHTVQGPEWTPPSSIGFVMGSIDVQNRLWLATLPTKDKDGLLGKKGEPAIYAREIATATLSGYTPREPKTTETYGKTGRAPHVVLTPPSSPKAPKKEDIQKIMDVKGNWDHFPISLDHLYRISNLAITRLKDQLQTLNLSANDIDIDLFKICKTERVLSLIEKGDLSIKEMQLDLVVTLKLMQNHEVIILLTDRVTNFKELIDIYCEYIEGTDNKIGEFSLIKFINIIQYFAQEFINLSSVHNLLIWEIIDMYNNPKEIFSTFGSDEVKSFFETYSGKSDIFGDGADLKEMINYYLNNRELFNDLIYDENNLLGNISVRDFIERYNNIQNKRISEVSDSDEEQMYFDNSFDEEESEFEDPYDILEGQIIYDGCPDEILRSLESSNSSNDEDEYGYCDEYDEDYDEYIYKDESDADFW